MPDMPPRRYDSLEAREQLGIPPDVQFTIHEVDLAHGATHGPAARRASSPRPLPLPDPKYLRIRADCYRVAHLSVAAEH